MSDLIDRQAAIDAIHCDITITGRQNAELVAATIGTFADRIKALPSAQPEQSNSSEFWRKRADFYSDMCMDLIGEMGKGVKVESVQISENGIAFIKEQPSAQPEIIRCKDCLMHGVCRFEQGLGLDGYCSKAERREECAI